MNNTIRYGGRNLGRQTCLIRSIIDERGLPKRNFVWAKLKYMVRWDCETGEVSTIKYDNGEQIIYAWYDELKHMEQSNDQMEQPAIR